MTVDPMLGVGTGCRAKASHNGVGHDHPRTSSALRSAWRNAFTKDEYVGQKSPVTASEIVALANNAGVEAGSLVLEPCCGTGGCALHLVRKLGCQMVGVDRSREDILMARAAAREIGLIDYVVFAESNLSQLPLAASFDAVLMINPMPECTATDKVSFLRGIHAALRPRGRLGLCIQVGRPLEMGRTPGANHAPWFMSRRELPSLFESAGFQICRVEDRTSDHARTATHLWQALCNRHEAIAREMGRDQCNNLLAVHEQWMEWLGSNRVHSLILIAERLD